MSLNITLEHDGSIKADEALYSYIEKAAKKWSVAIDQPVSPRELAVAIVIMLHRVYRENGISPEVTFNDPDLVSPDLLRENLEWVLDRRQKEPERPITPDELDMLYFPEHSTCTENCELVITQRDMCRFQSLVGPLQHDLRLPIEWHHIAMAFFFAINQGWLPPGIVSLSSPDCIKAIRRGLDHFVDRLGACRSSTRSLTRRTSTSPPGYHNSRHTAPMKRAIRLIQLDRDFG